jgi:hypothetical protein
VETDIIVDLSLINYITSRRQGEYKLVYSSIYC